ncbi:MAG: sigma 54-interacting transcriptional regulator [Desulfobacteraceae bacterium]|nr:sigma 54-interacting transcriptional regulator [Desulfobacteraceae bacterium]
MFIDNKDFKTMYKKWFQIFDLLSIGAFVTADKKIVTLNRSAMLLMGVKESDVADKTCHKLCCSIPCHGRCPFQGGMLQGTECPNVEIINGKGTRHMVTRFVVPVHTSDKKVKGCFTVLQDHSTLSELIQRVEHQERTLKNIFDSIDMGIFTVNKGGHVTFFNTAVEKISGYNRRQILGKNCSIIFGTNDKICASLLAKTMINGKSQINRKGRITNIEGEDIPILASYIPLKNEKDVIIGGLATIRDLTLAYQLNQVIKKQYTFHDMIGKDPVMQKIFEKAAVVAATNATVLIEGNTGTGKDLMAKVIHTASRRAEQPFVKVNCAAIPNNLLESEMFGYVRGAFTGAIKDKPGRFQEADGGTIFLDEIGDIPLELQAKLLRVLEDKEFYRLGSPRLIQVDVRIISATNRGLEKLMAKKLFREDLYYRLNVFRIDLPSLKKHQPDIPILIKHILRKLCAVRGYLYPGISEHAMKLLLNYDYPGNVRELENILEHALIICQEELIESHHLPVHIQNWVETDHSNGINNNTNISPQDDLEAKQILQALKRHQGNRTKTAQTLGMDRTTLWRKMKRFKISL